MIVVVSDLHLQHTRHDSIRRLENGRVIEYRIVRNVGAGALRLLLSEIAENVARTRATNVELVLAGDIFEIHRTPRWFLGGRDYRPVLHPPNEVIEKIVSGIVEDIVIDNREFFDVLAKVVSQGTFRRHGVDEKISAPLTVHYLPGNHDRLVDAFPSTRKRVRQLLCIEGPATDPFPHELVWDRSTGYGIFIRHGHEYDAINFPTTFDPRQPPSAAIYARPSFGDYVTVDITTRLAIAFRAHYACELRAPGNAGARFRTIYAALSEFDDVRPPSLLVKYLTDAVGSNALDVLRPVLRDVFETARADAFFVHEAERLNLGKYFEGPIAEIIDVALKNLSPETLSKLVDWLNALRKAEGSTPAAFAQHEPNLLSGDVDVILAGHTHNPAHVSVPGPQSVGYFLDTGTWRTRIDAGEGGTFGRLRGYTSVTCYHGDERKGDEHRNFETWTGHLLGDEYGAHEEEITAALPPAQRVVFSSCFVQHVDEGDTFDGAELELHFGVDDSAQEFRIDGVKDGARIALDREVAANPGLDGEVWCWGLEKDLGDSIIDRDDPLPWGVDFLDRDDGVFAKGKKTLRVSNNRGSGFILEYELLP